ncbi:hypothetical protein [Ideonella margarita]|uniref:Uncharacterized protein n=1 Tax=Ideonella margarita TaxID=2984191 RepID=A0ABU9C6K9_9BURK
MNFKSTALAALATLTLPMAAQAAVGAANCPGLKTGDYVALGPFDGDVTTRVEPVGLDATTLVVTTPDGPKQLTADADKCAFTTPEGLALRVANTSGVFLVTGENGGALVVPKQVVARKALAGTWNYMRQEQGTDGILHTYNGKLEVTATGRVTGTNCDSAGLNCGTQFKLGTLVAEAAGGFSVTNPEGVRTWLFPIKSKDGSLAMIGVDPEATLGAITVLAQARPLALPTAGDKFANWDKQFPGNGTYSPLAAYSYRILSTDPTTNSFVRRRTEDCRKETWVVNSGRDGLQFRKPGSSTLCDGSVASYGANLVMNLRSSFGFSVYGYESTNTHYFGMSIARP